MDDKLKKVKESKQVLEIPKEHLQEVIQVIRTGLYNIHTTKNVNENLTKWCDEMQECLK